MQRPDQPTGDSPLKNSYDEVAYVSYPFPQSHPNRLATIAHLFGVTPAAIENCRVLELGCSTGGNLIPMADQLPHSEFVGIDLSGMEIAEGRRKIEALGATNIQLEQKNILEIDADFGQFDYIIAHGIYSWVPDDVQNHLLHICRANLAPQGVAYVSYNTYPGWRMRGMIRDMMTYRARRFDLPADRLRQSRALLDFMSQSVPGEDNAYGILLKDELNQMREKQDYYLLHDYLEEVNEPVYFYEFVERATAHALQYLGEADYQVMSLSNFSRPAQAMLQSVAADLVEMEQYMDFLRNRMFRQTLLCHEGVSIDRSPAPERLLKMYLASSSKPEEPVGDVRSRDRVKFRGPSAVLNTSEPLVKAAMLHLAEMWPQAVSFPALFAQARSKLNEEPSLVDTGRMNADTYKLAEPMLRCYGTGQVELSLYAPQFTFHASDRPMASEFARYQASSGNEVTNMRHESKRLTDVQRQILPHLDGRHDHAALVDILSQLVASGSLIVLDRGKPVASPERLRQILDESLVQNLESLAKSGLLRG